jgi:hypothetical protein
MVLELPDFQSDEALWAEVFQDVPLDLSQIEVRGDFLPDRCRYKVEIAPQKPEQIVFFRLTSSESTSLKLVKQLAEIGSFVLGDLIPKHGATGHVRSLDWKEWEYLITGLVDNSLTMQAVWEKIEPNYVGPRNPTSCHLPAEYLAGR